MANKTSNLPFFIMGGIAALAMAGGVVFFVQKGKAERIAEARMWTAEGPPCLELTEAELAAEKLDLRHSFSYGGITLSRAFGAAECTDIHDDGGKGSGLHQVCTFTAPGIVRAKTAGADKIFQAKYAKPVTLSYQNGQFGCVLAQPGR